MKQIYLDTNFYIYSSDKNNQFYEECYRFIKYSIHNRITLTTSVETFQEIIHFSRNRREPHRGLDIAKHALELTDSILPITRETIGVFLEKANVYIKMTSRDILHLAVCLENNIDQIVTYDKEFKNFKEIKTLLPEEGIK